MSWWENMPSGIVSAYARALPRLQAEETLSLVQAGAASGGQLKSSDVKSYLRELKRQTKAGQKRKKAKPVNSAALSSMHIGIEIEEGG